MHPTTYKETCEIVRQERPDLNFKNQLRIAGKSWRQNPNNPKYDPETGEAPRYDSEEAKAERARNAKEFFAKAQEKIRREKGLPQVRSLNTSSVMAVKNGRGIKADSARFQVNDQRPVVLQTEEMFEEIPSEEEEY